jgi:hypothetical protein
MCCNRRKHVKFFDAHFTEAFPAYLSKYLKHMGLGILMRVKRRSITDIGVKISDT